MAESPVLADRAVNAFKVMLGREFRYHECFLQLFDG